MLEFHLVGIAQLVSASDCGSEGRGFESHYPPFPILICRMLGYPTELLTHIEKSALSKNGFQKRVMGIEPTYLAWKASVLPLNYTRM